MHKHLIILLFFLCLPPSTTAQTADAGDLLATSSCKTSSGSSADINAQIEACLTELSGLKAKSMESSVRDYQLARGYLDLGKLYARADNKSQQMNYHDKVKESPAFKTNVDIQYRYYRQVGLYAMHRQHFNEAENPLISALAIARQQKDTDWLAKSTNDLGLLSYKQKNYQEALEYFKESLRFKETLKNPYYVATTLNNIGLLNKDIGDLVSAIRYYEEALDQFILYTQSENFSNKVFSNISHLYEDLAVVYSLAEDKGKQDYYVNKLIETFNQKTTLQERLRAFKNLAMVHVEQGQTKSAELFLNQAITQVKNDTLYQDELAFIQASILFLREQFAKSKESANRTIVLAEKNGNSRLLSKVYLLLYQNDLAMQAYASAIENLKKHYEVKEKILADKYASDIGVIKEKIDKERVSRQLIEEQLENKTKENEIRVLTNTVLVVSLVLIVLMFSSGLIYYRKRKEQQALLDEINSHREKFFLLDGAQTEEASNEVADQTSEDSFRQQLVDLMIDTTTLWNKATNTSHIELAEKSNIWKVTIDSGRLRTRSLDKYLSVQKLPKNPRWRNVVKTAHFILAECRLEKSDRERLNKELEKLMAMVKQRSLDLKAA